MQNMKVLDHKTSYITLTQEELNLFLVKGDTEGIVNYGLSIKGIHFTAIFIENKEEKSKISFRSQGGFDVNQFAEIILMAADTATQLEKSEVSMEETIHKFENLVTK
jgi:phosphoesterase RecJ-like protein